jgi:SAM-dependent methyltransferase
MSIVRKIRRSLKRDGFSKTIALCFKNLQPRRKLDDQPTRFDIEYGVSTEGRIELGDLDIQSPSDLWGVGYSPTPPSVFHRILTLLPPPEDYSFVDLGAGKGRVVLMAAMKPFKCVTGVEFSRELCAVAEANLAKFKPHVLARQAQMVCEDAALFQFPSGPVIVYCYFAFGKEILIRVLDALSRRHDETIFVYYNAHYPELFAGFELMHAEGAICIWRSPPAQTSRAKQIPARLESKLQVHGIRLTA